MKTFPTLTEAVDELHSDGYIHDFRARFDRLQCTTNRKSYRPEEFEVDGRLSAHEGPGPDGSSIVYKIRATDGSKGIMVEPLGSINNPCSIEILEKLRKK